MSWLKKLFGKREHNGKTVRSSYLANHGWYLSLERRKARNPNGHSAATLPYSLTDFLDNRVYNSMAVYVRWDTHSYRYFHHKSHYVSSDHIAMHRVGDSNRGRFEHLDDTDVAHLENYAKAHNSKFQLMIVDGPSKRNEIVEILTMLNSNGVIVIVDDLMDAFDYDAVNKFMKQNGFRSIEFINPAPLYHELSATLYYRDGNCIGL